MSTWPATPNDPLFGSIIKTKYANGKFRRVVSVKRDCDCSAYLPGVNPFDRPLPKATSHFHFVSVPADEPHRDQYDQQICHYHNQVVAFGGGRFADVPERRHWNYKHFILRIIGRDSGPPLVHQGDLF